MISLIVSIIGFANQLVLANLFGASMSMDAYLIATSIPMLVSGVLCAALGFSLVPTLKLYQSDLETYRRFSGLLLVSLIIFTMVIACVGFFTAPTQIAMLGEELTPASRQDAITIARLTWMTAGTAIVGAYLNGVHNTTNRFILPVFASMLPFICMVLAGLAFAPAYGPTAVAWGQLAGFLLTIPVLLLHTPLAIDFSINCLLMWKDVARYLFRVPLITMAMLCFTVFQLSDSYWAPKIGVGNLSYLGYAQRILVVLSNIVIAGPAVVILPRLAEAYACGRIKDLMHDAYRAVRMVIAFALPLVLTVSILADPIVQLLFERGAFDRDATQNVAMILPLMMLGMMAMMSVVIIFRALFAKHDIALASLLGILITATYFTFSGFLSDHLGFIGIALAYALSWWIALFFSALALWRRYISTIVCRESLIFAIKLALLATLTVIVLALGRLWIGYADFGDALLLLQVVIVSVAAATVYFTVAIRVLAVKDISLIYVFFLQKYLIFKS